MDDVMEIDGTTFDTEPTALEAPQLSDSSTQTTSLMPLRDNFRDIQVKVHVRKPDRDTWMYLGRGLVSQEFSGHSSRIGMFPSLLGWRQLDASYRRNGYLVQLASVVRALSTGKIIVTFNENSDLQAEKRGSFVVIGCVEGSRVVSWSLNALNNSETLRLLASIELACYKCKQAITDPRAHSKVRRKIERVIKDDRRRRHRRRKDQDAMIDAFSKQNLSGEPSEQDSMVELNSAS